MADVTAEEKRAALIQRIAKVVHECHCHSECGAAPNTEDTSTSERVLALLESGEAGVYLVGGDDVQGTVGIVLGQLREARARVHVLEGELARERDLRGGDVVDRLAAEEEVERLRSELSSAHVSIRALVDQPRPDDDVKRAVWDAEQRAILLRQQVADLTAEVEEDAKVMQTLRRREEDASAEVVRLRSLYDEAREHLRKERLRYQLAEREVRARRAEMDQLQGQRDSAREDARTACQEAEDSRDAGYSLSLELTEANSDRDRLSTEVERLRTELASIRNNTDD